MTANFKTANEWGSKEFCRALTEGGGGGKYQANLIVTPPSPSEVNYNSHHSNVCHLLLLKDFALNANIYTKYPKHLTFVFSVTFSHWFLQRSLQPF